MQVAGERFRQLCLQLRFHFGRLFRRWPEHWYAQFNNTIHTTMGNFHETDLQALTKRMQLLYKRVRQPEAPLA